MPTTAFDPDDADHRCADLLEQPVIAVKAHESWFFSSCDILTSEGDLLARVPMSPGWWPWAAGALVFLCACAVILTLVALGLRHSGRRPLARVLVVLALVIVLATPRGLSLLHEYAESPDATALAQARQMTIPELAGNSAVVPISTSVDECDPAELSYWHVWNFAALGGHVTAAIAVQNDSKTACLVSGWPDVVVLDEQDQVLEVSVLHVDDQKATSPSHQEPPAVEIGPRVRAVATLRWDNDQTRPTGTHLEVTTPLGRQAVTKDPDPRYEEWGTAQDLTIPEGRLVLVSAWEHE
ncbi:DUF4232 domain-containing protein [Actinomyces sp. MRS3W]|uniref:DUF4232 domain-containing protein n=1 Tax=Actinomyces sp. MRS3W TaxID=2800796 RepID=UPI0028FD3B03|nr:DUF4232 domain-containing protein [Actinomyces sp. MRS3W]MDU0347336.1 DUF4232 domain-containing protein [Actinomyces sp. MRS3W]